MTAAIDAAIAPAGTWSRMRTGRTVPVLTFVIAILLIWYVAAILANGPLTQQALANANISPSPLQYVLATWAQQRPIVPAPHQVIVDFINSTLFADPTTNRSL